MSPMYCEKFRIPKHLEIADGAVVPAPVGEQPMMKTGNWRTDRPVIDHEKCTTCLNCFTYCPDGSWHFDEKAEKMVWNPIYCKGCRICVEVCPVDALHLENELNFKGGMARLEKPY
jgi:pyruvate ferredoxin oxidoreductase delta subunit